MGRCVWLRQGAIFEIRNIRHVQAVIASPDGWGGGKTVRKLEEF